LKQRVKRLRGVRVGVRSIHPQGWVPVETAALTTASTWLLL